MKKKLSIACFFLAGSLLVLVFLPASVWEKMLTSNPPWDDWDFSDLRRVKLVLSVLSFSLVLWGFYSGSLRVRNFLGGPGVNRLREDVFVGLVLVLTAWTVVQFFQVANEQIRVSLPPTTENPYSYGGRFLGTSWRIPLEPFDPRDYFTSIFLIVAAFASFSEAYVRRSFVSVRRRDLLPWGLMGIGLLWAGLDERLKLHEFLGANTPLLRDTTITKYPDDLVLLAYFLIAFGVFLYYWQAFRANKLALTFILLGGISQGLALVGNAWHIRLLPDEHFELIGALLYLMSVVLYAKYQQDSH